ncbi:MAG TPA: heterodisulfide reductase-related iron-sulfur binding cluster [Chloroflexota bacterium]
MNGEAGNLLGAEYENMLRCIRCGLCLSVCPTYQLTLLEEESPRGRIAMARAATEGYLPLTPDFVQHEESCLLCEACTAVCPAGVRMEELGVAVRATLAAQAPPRSRRARLGQRLGFWLLADLGRLRRLLGLLRLYQRSGLQALVRRTGLLRLLGLADAEGYLPRLDAPFLVPQGQVWEPRRLPVPPQHWEGQGGPSSPPGGQGDARRRVALFAGCVMSTAFAATDRATARVLAANGVRVEAPAGQGCCGALHAHGGDREGARALARRNVAAFEAGGYDAVVVSAAGCGAMLKEYGHLLADDPAWAERAAEFAGRVRDLSEYLAALGPEPPSGRVETTVTYQDPCHLAHAQRVRRQPRALLQQVPGLRLVEMAESDLCCGSAGVYNLTHPETAEQLQARKLDNVAATGAPVVVTANPGCLLQLQAGAARRGLDVQVRHIADVLDEAYAAAPAPDHAYVKPRVRPGAEVLAEMSGSAATPATPAADASRAGPAAVPESTGGAVAAANAPEARPRAASEGE